MNIRTSIYALFDYITDNKLMGTIPLDILAHFFIGALLTIIFLKLKLQHIIVLFLLALIATIKEIWDFQRMVDPDFLESLKDILITLSFCFFTYLIKIYKRIESLKFRNTSKDINIR